VARVRRAERDAPA